ncbi:Galactinol synthase 7 [Raphanus sativus]|nr:Galactinol synthase 7 [Raphanus sativus]
MDPVNLRQKAHQQRAYIYDVPGREILRSQGCILREIEPVYPPGDQVSYARDYYIINYSKLRIWNLIEYNKVVFLDADIQVYDNIDELFDLPDGYLHGVIGMFL